MRSHINATRNRPEGFQVRGMTLLVGNRECLSNLPASRKTIRVRESGPFSRRCPRSSPCHSMARGAGHRESGRGQMGDNTGWRSSDRAASRRKNARPHQAANSRVQQLGGHAVTSMAIHGEADRAHPTATGCALYRETVREISPGESRRSVIGQCMADMGSDLNSAEEQPAPLRF